MILRGPDSLPCNGNINDGDIDDDDDGDDGDDNDDGDEDVWVRVGGSDEDQCPLSSLGILRSRV